MRLCRAAGLCVLRGERPTSETSETSPLDRRNRTAFNCQRAGVTHALWRTCHQRCLHLRNVRNIRNLALSCPDISSKSRVWKWKKVEACMLVSGFGLPDALLLGCGNVTTSTSKHPCTSARCDTIKKFLKDHYCGESPFGNGPDDGCDLRVERKTVATTKVAAHYKCEWNAAESKSQCQQHGQPSPEFRDIVLRELRRLGLPGNGVPGQRDVRWLGREGGKGRALHRSAVCVGVVPAGGRLRSGGRNRFNALRGYGCG